MGFREDYVNGEFKQALPDSNVLHYNFVKMAGYFNMPITSEPDEWAKLAKNTKSQIRGIIETSFNKEENGLISKNATASIDGLYLIECSSDNHTFHELYKYRKGERIWQYFEKEYEHPNGETMVKPINIVNIVLETNTE